MAAAMAAPEPVRAFGWRAYPSIWSLVALIRLLAPFDARKDRIPADIEVAHTAVPSRDVKRAIKATVYRARDARPSGKVLLNWHGSAFVLPRLGEDKTYCAWVAGQLREHGVQVIDLDYRKAPEHPFPLAIEDAEDAILHFASAQDVTHIALGGFSAGGAFSVSAAAQTKPVLEARGQAGKVGSLTAIYPISDMRPTAKRSAPHAEAGAGGALLHWLAKVCISAFLVHPDSCHDKRASITLHTPDELPPHVLIITGSADGLHDDSLAFIESLQHASPPHPDAQFLSINRQAHGFDKKKSPDCLAAREEAYQAALQCIKKGLDIA